MANSTKILDTTLSILKGDGVAKRAKRVAQVEITLTYAPSGYVIQANDRVLETGSGSLEYARARTEDRKHAVERMGKTVIVKEYA